MSDVTQFNRVIWRTEHAVRCGPATHLCALQRSLQRGEGEERIPSQISC
jgi:hypothetical protein